MSVEASKTVRELVLANPAAARTLEQFGIDYCCGGGKSLHEACLHADVPVEEILKRLRENSKDISPDEANWTSASLGDLTRHIRERHHRYVREAITRVQTLLDEIGTKQGENHPEITDIQRLFTEVGREMIMHMQKEEQILFPYIDALEKAANAHGSVEPPFFQTVRNPIQAMMKEHDAAGELVKLIRKASSEYTAPEEACPRYKALCEDLREFEADLHQHVHLENNILFPRAVEMEATVV